MLLPATGTSSSGRNMRTASGLSCKVVAHHRVEGRQSRGDREAVAGIGDSAVEDALQRQAAVSRMRFGPARHRARHGQRRRDDAAQRDLAMPRASAHCGCALGRLAAAIEIADRRSRRHGSARTHRRRGRSCADRPPRARLMSRWRHRPPSRRRAARRRRRWRPAHAARSPCHSSKCRGPAVDNVQSSPPVKHSSGKSAGQAHYIRAHRISPIRCSASDRRCRPCGRSRHWACRADARSASPAGRPAR